MAKAFESDSLCIYEVSHWREIIVKQLKSMVGCVLPGGNEQDFEKWCREQIEHRNRLRTQEHDLIIDMDPEIA